ncbi:MAG: geranylgeranylglyceryl/heptaprenylglyceryl phosphate synthase [Chitinophagales bacterium]|nr:geranylgeranylglyceryl/heptaprenylglyceryl phosphate synthase [Chitinophagales bacterium]
MKKNIYHRLLAAKANKQKKFVVLIDPDKVTPESLIKTIDISVKAGVDYFFIGGSLLINDSIAECCDVIKSYCEVPVIIFPGSPSQIHSNADGILLLSLISGRNPDLLIGQQVIAAAALRESELEIISTGYILVDGGNATTVSYISNTFPIPYHKDDIAMSTAMAGEMLGLKLIYLEAGSGANNCVSENMVHRVAENVDVPIIVGGGISSPEKALALCKSGADIIVIGTAAEKNPEIIFQMSDAIHKSEFA